MSAFRVRLPYGIMSHRQKYTCPGGGETGWYTLRFTQSVDGTSSTVFTGHLNKYYDQVISCIRDAESILIFGPGEAKVELQKRLENEALGGRVAGIETVDKMTDRQIAARVRQRFPKQNPGNKKMPRSLSVTL